MKIKVIAVSAMAIGALVLFTQCSKPAADQKAAEMTAPDHDAVPAEGVKVVTQTLASAEVAVGEWTVCPVMRTKFQVKATSLYVEIGGKKVYVCCAACVEPLKANPKKFL
jgi:YHS domain-containing protein